MSGLVGRLVRGPVSGGQIVEGEVVALTSSESGVTLYMWIVNADGVLRCVVEGGSMRTVVLPRDAEGPLR